MGETIQEDPGLDRLLSRPRVLAAHRLGADLLVEAELTRERRPEPVPFVLGYTTTGLEHAHAGASSVTVAGDGYLFLSDLRCAVQRARGHGGRSLRRHRPGPRREPELVFSSHKGVVSYAAAGQTAVAAVWLPPDASSLHVPPVEDHVTAQVLRGDLWPRSAHRFDGDVLRIARVPLDGGQPSLLPLRLEPMTELTGALALTPDTCAAGVVRFLPGGHRRYGQLLFPLSAPGDATALWWEDDLVDLVPAPSGKWFAATAERVARPGRAPRQEAVLVAADGSHVVRAAPRHPDWLQPKAWDGDTLLCVGEQDGQRHLWRVRDGGATRVDLAGSVQSVTTADEVLVVRSHIDLPPEVVSLSGDVVLAPAAAATPSGRRERLTHHARDGSVWRSWLCLPAEDPGHPLPVLVWCHGGPLLSWTDWSWRWNPWPFVAAGYAVLMPDPPLSVGYGQDAVERGWGRWTTDVAAVAAAQVRAALTHPSLDETSVATMGASAR
jgi:hypothetical protein